MFTVAKRKSPRRSRLGNRDWEQGAGQQGSRGAGETRGTREGRRNNAQCPMPNAQCPMPN
ncbi:MAG: hypothetical protein ACRAVC_10155 [Trichormus sp.]